MGSFNAFIEQKLGKLPHFVIYAILEWIMIILLFIVGFIAFFSNEFAKFFELQIPCLLCTKLDHIFLHRNSNFYYDSICEVHKKDISTLAYCHVHKKLSDIRIMCQGCLLSFATEKNSGVDKYKSIVGILHKDVDSYNVEGEKRFFMKPFKRDGNGIEIYDEKGGFSRCSCCGEPSKSKSKYKRSLSMNAPTPSPRAPFYGSRNEEGGNVVDLPHHLRYTELKLMSDSESEVPEDEDASNGDHQTGREDPKAATMPLLPDPDDINEDVQRTPSFIKGNRFFGIPLFDSTQASPRWANRASRKLPGDLIADPTDASGLHDGDGDILTRLKRQIRLDQRTLMALYMELDEERSASAVAANNAMAMITRLQAEKASLQMEALQYQRMMEEQAEYDQEALQVMQDLLFKRDEDVKALESELETYREKYGVIKKVGSEICEVDVDDDYQDIKSQALSDCESPFEGPYERAVEYGGGNLDESSLDFEGERSYLMTLLRNLEKNIDQTSESSSAEVECSGNEGKAVLTREVSLIRERLRAIEADSGFLKHAAMTLQRGGEGTKLLTEIAQHLRSLKQPVKSPSEEIEP